jgi:hypothetical protein
MEPRRSEDSIYPDAEVNELLAEHRPNLQSSALHRMLTFPIYIQRKLRLNVEALASVGIFWNNKVGRLQCAICKRKQMSVAEWQDLNYKQVQLRHYDCTHHAEDDIPNSKDTTFLYFEAHRLYTFYQDRYFGDLFITLLYCKLERLLQKVNKINYF